MILPDPGPDTAPYWTGAREGELRLRYCPGCERWQHPRVAQCCEGIALEWRAASGRGTLLSYAVVRLALQPALTAEVPYTVTYTRTREGPLLVTALRGDAQVLRVGMPMEISFDKVGESVALPRFVPAG
jgi:hypothetical protein